MPAEVDIYTDGACSGNPGPGGYGAVLLYGKTRKELSGGFRWTTNNRMELRGLIEALAALKKPCRLNIRSDSRYVLRALEEGWLKKWQKNGWRTSAKMPVQNQDLWERLDELLKVHDARFTWVKGHSTNQENNRCDELAVAARSRSLGIDAGYEETSPFQC